MAMSATATNNPVIRIRNSPLSREHTTTAATARACPRDTGQAFLRDAAVIERKPASIEQERRQWKPLDPISNRASLCDLVAVPLTDRENPSRLWKETGTRDSGLGTRDSDSGLGTRDSGLGTRARDSGLGTRD